ncbi:MAG: nucleoside diphosphate kinase regulator [Alphaproteobacteria bacterium]|jgi:regulator of nucleoside diphosphate kinase|nr:nucleoside diphosphate kinase regulator [Alphaproteobacteria bacterium]MCC7036798.1 nucleoside diphosphate kinase regulator [Alphaproteobacteria bacterium]
MLNTHHASKPEIHVTDRDREILERLASGVRAASEVAEELMRELERAGTAKDGDAENYVGLGTKLTFATSAGEEKTVELVMPAEADISAGKISIMTPVGVALLGLSKGQTIEWNARDGRAGTLTIVEIF